LLAAAGNHAGDQRFFCNFAKHRRGDSRGRKRGRVAWWARRPVGREKRHARGVTRGICHEGSREADNTQRDAAMNRSRERFIDNRFLQLVLGCYMVFWIALAIRPLDRSDWFLENLLVFATASVLIPTYRRF